MWNWKYLFKQKQSQFSRREGELIDVKKTETLIS
jgi:hypothetical protein